MLSNMTRTSGLVLVCLSICSLTSAQVSFNQAPTYSGSSKLFVTDFDEDGKLDVFSQDTFLNLGNGDGTFQQSRVVPTDFNRVEVVADFNGDGKPDLLEQGNGTLLVYLGNGDGTFQPPVSTPSGAAISSFASADLNNDGRADVVGVYGSTLLVYISKGDGTFYVGVPYGIPAITLGWLAVSIGDFNGDGKPDVVLAGSPSTSDPGLILVFLGNGDGTLQAPKSSAGAVYATHSGIGDFNNDGKLDLALSSDSPFCTSSCVEIFLGNGDGTFHAPITGVPEYGPFASADVNNDGKLDLIFSSDPTIARIYLGNGDGSFSNLGNYLLKIPNPNLPVPPLASGPAVADFNHDGNMDVVVGNAVLLGNGDGTFRGVILNLLPTSPKAFTVGNFSKTNSNPGVAVLSDQTVYVMNNDGTGKLTLAQTYTIPDPGGRAIFSGDFNGDGNADLIVIGDVGQTGVWFYSVLLGNGDGTFQVPTYAPQDTMLVNLYFQPHSVTLGDFVNNRRSDLVLAGGANQSVGVLIANEDGTFSPPQYVFAGEAATVVTGDFNQDGKLDFAAGNVFGFNTALLFGNVDGTFQAAIFPPIFISSVGSRGFSAELSADLNHDGMPDLISGTAVSLGNGDGSFQAPSVVAYMEEVLAAADMNGDGIPDLVAKFQNAVTVDPSTDYIGIILGNGDGTFGSVTPAPTGFLPPDSLVADMNSDGRPDILVRWQGGVATFLNETPAGFAMAASPISPVTVVAGNSATSTVTIVRTFGFNGAVALACPGLLAGVGCQFNPSTIPSGSNSSTLTVTTASTAGASSIAIQVLASSGSMVHSVSLPLTIQLAPDFSVNASSNSSQTISAGQSAPFTLTFTAIGGFSDTVNLTCAITPVVTPPPTCSLSRPSVQVGANGATVTVTVGTTGTTTTSSAPSMDVPPVFQPLALAVMFATCAGLLLSNRARRSVLLATSGLAISIVSLAACGGNSTHIVPGTPAGTYTPKVTAAGPGVTHITTLQVVVH
jgi:hypothetical protein